jgi:hypothetical protein
MSSEVAKWCAQHPTAVLFDEPTATLRDVFSNKTLRLPRVRATEEKKARDSGESYLVVALDEQRQIALAGVGIAFPPDMHNAGPLPGMPPVVCWRDFANVTAQIDHALNAHPDEPPGREVLDMLRYCIALCDGARTVGFDVGEEERRLEGYVTTIEKRVGKP